jgi:hypothetical protein
MELESHFGPFRDSVSVGALVQKSFYTHPLKLLGDVGLMESHFGPFGDNVIVGAK